MTELTQITNHVEEAQAKLLYQFRTASESPNMMDLIECLISEIQELENVFFDILVYRTLANATGQTLNYIGENVGLPRTVSGPDASDDNIYRQLIRAKIAENVSEGTGPDLKQILQIFAATEILSFDIPHATKEYNIKGDFIVDLSYIKNGIIKGSLPVAINLSSYTDHPFGFADDPTAFGFGEGELGSTE